MLVVAFSAVGVRLAHLQVLHPDEYVQRGEAQRIRTVALPAERGSIFDRARRELAMSTRQHTIWTDPRLVEDPVAAAAALAPVLGVDESTLAARLGGDGKFAYLARKVDDEVAARVEELALPGVSLLDESERFRPGGDLASSILGTVDIDNKGTSGLEQRYEDKLVGEPGELLLERGIDGRRIAAGEHHLSPAQRGDDLVLTIDRSLQFEVERSLGEQVVATGAEAGYAIVMDPHTGEVLAMANMADGDGDGEAEAVSYNKAVTDIYEPGSVMKVVTGAAALEEGLRTPDQPWQVPASIRLPGKQRPVTDGHPIAGTGTLRDVLTRSSNVGTIQLARELGPERLHEYLRRFGFGERTGIGFKEGRGRVPHPDDWSGPSLGTISIGQGVSVNGLQMLSAYNALANGGELVEPTLVRSIIDADGDEHRLGRTERRRVVSEDTAAAMRDMLTDVVASDQGTGQLAQVIGYDVAGKTGTAQKPATGGGGYESGAYMATFAGFVPAGAPRLSAIVVLDEPSPHYGGVSSAPVFADIARYALRHFRIPPPADADAEDVPTAPVPEDAVVPRD